MADVALTVAVAFTAEGLMVVAVDSTGAADTTAVVFVAGCQPHPDTRAGRDPPDLRLVRTAIQPTLGTTEPSGMTRVALLARPETTDWEWLRDLALACASARWQGLAISVMLELGDRRSPILVTARLGGTPSGARAVAQSQRLAVTAAPWEDGIRSGPRSTVLGRPRLAISLTLQVSGMRSATRKMLVL
jgi:hypothetical protein